MDKLDEIFSQQRELDNFIKSSRGLNFSQSEWIQKKCLALMDEVVELLNEVNYKWWKNEKPINEQNVKEEICDILHFFISICIDANMSADELYQIYINKNKENHNRQLGKSEKQGYDLKKA